MTEKTIELELPLLLPGVEAEQDGCLERLEAALENREGILRSHLERDTTPVQLCLHYDPTVVSVDDVRRVAERAGAGIVDRYHHERLPVEGMDCSDCALVFLISRIILSTSSPLTTSASFFDSIFFRLSL